MADFAIQRGRATCSSAAASVTITAGVDYTAPASSSAAFIRIVGSNFNSSGDHSNDFNGPPDRNCFLITNPSNITTSITFTRTDSSGGPFDIEWEIIEYTGSIGGANEIIVRHTEVLTATTTASTADSSTVSGVSDSNALVVFITSSDVTLAARGEVEEFCWTSEYISGSSIARCTRGTGVIRTSSVTIAVVEFTGSNWANVQRVVHTYSAGNTAETETLGTTLGDTTKAFIHHQSYTNSYNDGARNGGQECWISSTTQLTFKKYSITTGAVGVAWVVENTQSTGDVMTVSQYSGVQASNTSTDPESFTDTITSVTVAESSIMGEGCNTTHSSDSHIVMLGFRLTDATTVTMRRGRDLGNRDWRYQVVEWPSAAAAGGRIMGSLARYGGLAGYGGIAGKGGGLAG